MSENNFYLISTASGDIYEDNTRTHFKNDLPITLDTTTGTVIAISNVIFEKTFNFYPPLNSATDVNDLVLLVGTELKGLKIKKTYSLFALTTYLNKKFCSFSNLVNERNPLAVATVKNNKLELSCFYGQILISKTFADFFHFKNLKEFENDSQFLVLREEEEIGINTYTSQNIVKLNEHHPSFLYVSCNLCEPYELKNKQCQILSIIPIHTNRQTLFYENFNLHFHTVNAPQIRTIDIQFLQPNFQKVFFADGSPTIIKMSLVPHVSKKVFYITVSSEKTLSFPHNSLHKFQVELLKEYFLSGHWQVSVTNVYLPPPRNFLQISSLFTKIKQQHNYFYVGYSNQPMTEFKFAQLPLAEFTKKELCVFLLREFRDYFKVFLDEQEQIFLSTTGKRKQQQDVVIFTSAPYVQMLMYDKLIRTVKKTTREAIWAEKFNFVVQHLKSQDLAPDLLFGMNLAATYEKIVNVKNTNFLFSAEDFYDFSPADANLLVKPDFTRLANAGNSQYVLSEEARLIELYQAQLPRSKNNFIPPFFFIYADFVQQTIMGNDFVNLLKMVPYRHSDQDLPGGMFIPSTNEYFNVNRQVLKNLEFKICTHSGTAYQYFEGEGEQILITLKFVQV